MTESQVTLVYIVLSFVVIMSSIPCLEGRKCSRPCVCYNASFPGFEDPTAVLVMDCSQLGLFYAPHVPREITVLNLSTNMFDEFPAMLLSDTRIRALLLQNNEITMLPEIHKDSKLEYLDLSGNDVQLTDKGFSQGFRNVKTIKIQTSQLHRTSFKGLSNLEDLHLTVHDQGIPPDIFQASDIANTLKRLCVVASVIPPTLFHPLQSIQEIALHLEPKQTILADNTFNSTSLRKLKKLFINARDLKISGRELLMNLEELQTIVLEVDTETLPFDIFYKPNVGLPCSERSDACFQKQNRFYLQRITISGVKELPDSIFDYVSFLDYLNISGSENPPEGLLDNVTLLSCLILTHDNIRSITPALLPATMTVLLHLNLSYNDIESVTDESFTNTPALEMLDLSHNQISIVHRNAFQNIENSLQYLNLSHNNICHLPSGVFKGLTSLKILHLEFNCLVKIAPDLFRDLNQLSRLHLQVNNIGQITDSALVGLHNLEYLHLNDNEIGVISLGVLRYMYTSALRYLDLSKNRIENLPVFDPPQNTSLAYFLISSNNKLTCDCGVVPLINLAHADGFCAKPDWLAGKAIRDLNPLLICPETTEKVIETTLHADTSEPSYTSTGTATYQEFISLVGGTGPTQSTYQPSKNERAVSENILPPARRGDLGYVIMDYSAYDDDLPNQDKTTDSFQLGLDVTIPRSVFEDISQTPPGDLPFSSEALRSTGVQTTDDGQIGRGNKTDLSTVDYSPSGYSPPAYHSPHSSTGFIKDPDIAAGNTTANVYRGDASPEDRYVLNGTVKYSTLSNASTDGFEEDHYTRYVSTKDFEADTTEKPISIPEGGGMLYETTSVSATDEWVEHFPTNLAVESSDSLSGHKVSHHTRDTDSADDVEFTSSETVTQSRTTIGDHFLEEYISSHESSSKEYDALREITEDLLSGSTTLSSIHDNTNGFLDSRSSAHQNGTYPDGEDTSTSIFHRDEEHDVSGAGTTRSTVSGTSPRVPEASSLTDQYTTTLSTDKRTADKMTDLDVKTGSTDHLIGDEVMVRSVTPFLFDNASVGSRDPYFAPGKDVRQSDRDSDLTSGTVIHVTDDYVKLGNTTLSSADEITAGLYEEYVSPHEVNTDTDIGFADGYPILQTEDKELLLESSPVPSADEHTPAAPDKGAGESTVGFLKHSTSSDKTSTVHEKEIGFARGSTLSQKEDEDLSRHSTALPPVNESTTGRPHEYASPYIITESDLKDYGVTSETHFHVPEDDIKLTQSTTPFSVDTTEYRADETGRRTKKDDDMTPYSSDAADIYRHSVASEDKDVLYKKETLPSPAENTGTFSEDFTSPRKDSSSAAWGYDITDGSTDQSGSGDTLSKNNTYHSTDKVTEVNGGGLLMINTAEDLNFASDGPVSAPQLSIDSSASSLHEESITGSRYGQSTRDHDDIVGEDTTSVVGTADSFQDSRAPAYRENIQSANTVVVLDRITVSSPVDESYAQFAEDLVATHRASINVDNDQQFASGSTAHFTEYADALSDDAAISSTGKGTQLEEYGSTHFAKHRRIANESTSHVTGHDDVLSESTSVSSASDSGADMAEGRFSLRAGSTSTVREFAVTKENSTPVMDDHDVKLQGTDHSSFGRITADFREYEESSYKISFEDRLRTTERAQGGGRLSSKSTDSFVQEDITPHGRSSDVESDGDSTRESYVYKRKDGDVFPGSLTPFSSDKSTGGFQDEGGVSSYKITSESVNDHTGVSERDDDVAWESTVHYQFTKGTDFVENDVSPYVGGSRSTKDGFTLISSTVQQSEDEDVPQTSTDTYTDLGKSTVRVLSRGDYTSIDKDLDKTSRTDGLSKEHISFYGITAQTPKRYDFISERLAEAPEDGDVLLEGTTTDSVDGLIVDISSYETGTYHVKEMPITSESTTKLSEDDNVRDKVTPVSLAGGVTDDVIEDGASDSESRTQLTEVDFAIKGTGQIHVDATLTGLRDDFPLPDKGSTVVMTEYDLGRTVSFHPAKDDEPFIADTTMSPVDDSVHGVAGGLSGDPSSSEAITHSARDPDYRNLITSHQTADDSKRSSSEGETIKLARDYTVMTEYDGLPKSTSSSVVGRTAESEYYDGDSSVKSYDTENVPRVNFSEDGDASHEYTSSSLTDGVMSEISQGHITNYSGNMNDAAHDVKITLHQSDDTDLFHEGTTPTSFSRRPPDVIGDYDFAGRSSVHVITELTSPPSVENGTAVFPQALDSFYEDNHPTTASTRERTDDLPESPISTRPEKEDHFTSRTAILRSGYTAISRESTAHSAADHSTIVVPEAHVSARKATVASVQDSIITSDVLPDSVTATLYRTYGGYPDGHVPTYDDGIRSTEDDNLAAGFPVKHGTLCKDAGLPTSGHSAASTAQFSEDSFAVVYTTHLPGGDGVWNENVISSSVEANAEYRASDDTSAESAKTKAVISDAGITDQITKRFTEKHINVSFDEILITATSEAIQSENATGEFLEMVLSSVPQESSSNNLIYFVGGAVLFGIALFAVLFYVIFKQRGQMYERSYTVNYV